LENIVGRTTNLHIRISELRAVAMLVTSSAVLCNQVLG